MGGSTLAANITKSTIDQFERKYGHEDKYEWPIRQMANASLSDGVFVKRTGWVNL